MGNRHYHIVLNARSGAALALGLTAEVLRQHFSAHGHEVSIDDDEDTPLNERVRAAATGDADVIVSAGGDGTATALAAGLAGTGKALAILPLGTANLLARDLKLPLDLEATIAMMDAMEPRQIDVGEVNGRVFLHKVVVGTIPAIAAAREQIRERKDPGALLGFLSYFVRRLTRARRMAVAITSRDTNDRVERVQAIAVANNAYDEGWGRVFARSSLDSGKLTLYIVRHLTLGDVVRLSAEMIAGRWQTDEALGIESVGAVTLRSKRQQVSVMIDGEVEKMAMPLDFRIRPKALTVLAPAAAPVATTTVAEPQPEPA